ncbi:ATP-binding protein [Streptomyces vinaceus]|uniref:ATP-binding protein n=1 Tax=Streptomyces vinaceus TaxID=1960 RepID=A0A5J6J503_STRVI|nr:AAA family ATPase [Streptomyces vinaceus]QEV45243.1 ATP-binding protein [Streptomyces vinaceus]GHE71405.1 hypothetical protein GCM10017778_65770 [Streptomyces vinaceus]
MSSQVIAVVTAVVLPLLLTELGDWCPWLAKRLVQWTARRLGDAAVAERYSEEWLAELEEVPGKLSRLIVATGKFLALPKSRWVLRAQRRAADGQLSFGDLLPTGRPSYWDRLEASGTMVGRVGQSEVCYRLTDAVLDADARSRNRLHMLVGPAGCGKTVALQWIDAALRQQGKEVHYLHAAWSPTAFQLDRRSRKRLVKASAEVGLLMVDEADVATIHALESLRLRCPVLIVGRTHPTRQPVNAGVVMDLSPLPGGILGGLH